jgi:HSP20 family protein
MIDRKQTFLERLTGTQQIDDSDVTLTVSHDDTADDTDHDVEVSTTADIKDPGEAKDSAMPKIDDVDDETPPEESDADANDDLDEEVEAGLAIDMFESDNELIIQTMIAGVTPENLNISITRDTVTIKGERLSPKIPDKNYLERELYWGVFSREIILPYEIDTDAAEAIEKYGLLIIRLPKVDSNRTQELKVKSI